MARQDSVLAKLFLAERDGGGRASDAWARFFASLTPEEAALPLAAWLARKRDVLDWDENVCDMVGRHFGIPQKPLWPAEQGNGYEEAAVALERRLRAPDGPIPR